MLSKKDLIIFLLIGVIIFTNFRQNKKIEKMSNIDTIKTVVNKLYKADVQSIRNLAEISQKLQRGTLTIPGNLTVKGSLNVNGKTQMNNDLTFANAKSIRGHRLHIATNEKLYLLPKGGVHITKDWGSSGHVYANSLDIKGRHGTTHFNYANRGDTYLRDNVYVHDFMRTNRLDIKAKRGTTHFNYANKGKTYFRDTIGDSSNLYAIGQPIYIYQRNGWYGRNYLHGHKNGRVGVAATRYKTRFELYR